MPFDATFTALLHDVLLAAHDGGFVARHALETVVGAEFRLDRICRLVCLLLRCQVFTCLSFRRAAEQVL